MNIKSLVGRTVASVEQTVEIGQSSLQITFTDGSKAAIWALLDYNGLDSDVSMDVDIIDGPLQSTVSSRPLGQGPEENEYKD